MSRFYVSPEDVRDDKIYISGKEVRHIVKVLRLRKGDRIIAFDGSGKEYLASIEKASLTEVVVGIEEVRFRKVSQRLSITLAQAIPRKGRMDYIVQKCSELGVSRIIPIQTARTVVKLEEKRRQLCRKRWQKLAVEASKQCGRVLVCDIYDLRSFEDSLEILNDYDLALIPCLAEGAKPLKDVLISYKGRTISPGERLKVLIFIGPEGDFTPQEIEEAKAAGAIPVALGENVLRSDTAAVVSVAIVNYEFE